MTHVCPMSPRWESLASPIEPEGPLLMDAELRPHRALPVRAFWAVLLVFALANLVLASIFWAQGAYPVAGFLGLDVVALGLAFALNYRSGRAVERVRLDRARLIVSRAAPGRREAHWGVSPFWARVEQDGLGVRIAAGGRAVRVGSFLSPEERTAFAGALRAALRRAR